MIQKVMLAGALVLAGALGAGAVKLTEPGQCEQAVAVAPQPIAGPDQEILGTSTSVTPEALAVPALKSGETRVSTRTSYENPAGFDDIGFSVVVDDKDVITDASVDVLATHEISLARQQSFAEILPRVLKGKRLHELEALDLVGEASLTTKAFNESLKKLQASF